jgi:DNA-binding MarR family transcriptional regulator
MEEQEGQQGRAEAPTSGPARPSAREAAEWRLIDLLRSFTLEVDRFVEVFAAEHGLHRTDLNAVAHLARASLENRALTAGELSRLLSLSPSATTTLLDRLENAGHVERGHDPVDRRRVLVRIRPSAHDVALAFFIPLGQRMRAAMADYGLEDLHLANDVIARMLTATTAAANQASEAQP